MGNTLEALKQLLIGSIPTIVIFLLLHAILRRTLYAPLQRVLKARRDRIEGRLDAARQLLALAETKLVGYEEALRAARHQGYAAVDARRRAAMELARKNLEQVQDEAARQIAAAREQLASDSEQIRRHLQADAETLAKEVAGVILGRPQSAKPGVTA